MIRFTLSRLTLCALTLLAFTACEDDNAGIETVEIAQPEARFMDLSQFTSKQTFGKSAEGYNIVLHKVEYITSLEGEEMGNTIFFSNRGNKQIEAEWEAGAQLIDGTTDVTYYIDRTRPSEDADVSETTASLQRQFATWEDVKCSELNLTEVPFDGRPVGVVAAILGYGGSFFTVADIVQAGFLPAEFFDNFGVNGGRNILGATFTFTYEDAFGIAIDTDNDGTLAIAITEVYYNDGFDWSADSRFDFESVALHETGHALGQEHFGKVFRTNSNNKIHFSPRAVMNAGYTGVNRDIKATDNAGHCANWGNWPNQ